MIRTATVALFAATCVAWPFAVQAQEMTCTPTLAEQPALAALQTALDQVDGIYPNLTDAFHAAVKAVCIAEPPVGAQGFFEPDTRHMVLAADLPVGLQQAVFFHELRHAQQFAIDACPVPGLSMREHAEVIFAMEADASVATVVIADALRANGDPAMWNALANWPLQADILAAYATARAAGQDVALAASAAFDQWYANETRKDLYYVDSCLRFLEEQEREHRLPSYGTVDPAFFGRLCRLPDGTEYVCAPPE